MVPAVAGTTALLTLLTRQPSLQGEAAENRRHCPGCLSHACPARVARRPNVLARATGLATTALVGAALLVTSRRLRFPAGTRASAEATLWQLLNGARANNGLNVLVQHGTLVSLARWRSADLIDRNYFSHTILGTGYQVYHWYDTNGLTTALVARTRGTAATRTLTPVAAHNGFMNSSGHRANILRPGWTHGGVGASLRWRHVPRLAAKPAHLHRAVHDRPAVAAAAVGEAAVGAAAAVAAEAASLGRSRPRPCLRASCRPRAPDRRPRRSTAAACSCTRPMTSPSASGRPVYPDRDAATGRGTEPPGRGRRTGRARRVRDVLRLPDRVPVRLIRPVLSRPYPVAR